MSEVGTGLRARQREARWSAILDATAALLRERPLDAVTVQDIAGLAQVSPATVFNLVGTRDVLLLALADRVLDVVVSDALAVYASEPDPADALRRVVDGAVARLTADSAVHRQVVGAVGHLAARGTRVASDPAGAFLAGLRGAQRAGLVDTRTPADVLARQVYLGFLGAMFAWSGGGLTDAGFLAAARNTLGVVLVAAATPAHRDRFAAQLANWEAELAAAGWKPREADGSMEADSGQDRMVSR